MKIDLQNLPGTGKNGDHRVFSNFYEDQNIIQQVCITQPKNLIIDSLRSRFAKDNVFTYRTDDYGFPLTPDLTGVSTDSSLTTQILISDSFRYDVKFYPNIVIKSGGGSYKPLSFNQNGTIKYRKDYYDDSFGIRRFLNTPTHRVYAGMWDMNFEVIISTEDTPTLQRLVDIVSLELQYGSWNKLRENGLFIKSLNISSEAQEPYANDYVYSTTISISTYSEWRVEIPLENIIEKLVFYFDSVKTPSDPSRDLSELQSLKYEDVIEMIEIDLNS